MSHINKGKAKIEYLVAVMQVPLGETLADGLKGPYTVHTGVSRRAAGMQRPAL